MAALNPSISDDLIDFCGQLVFLCGGHDLLKEFRLRFVSTFCRGLSVRDFAGLLMFGLIFCSIRLICCFKASSEHDNSRGTVGVYFQGHALRGGPPKVRSSSSVGFFLCLVTVSPNVFWRKWYAEVMEIEQYTLQASGKLKIEYFHISVKTETNLFTRVVSRLFYQPFLIYLR